ncbi:uncharacterized protein LOC119906134 [Micropterus salmoides]|uniref:uncharacterized protein LOC119906134 n=1 Tax=Micropterus salmoides TaxID=27706 RepID=UPI0018EB2473|nr:uncharacterized protein LOC119906134 [Micropterus salmoides]
MQSLLTNLVSGRLSTYAAIILMFTYSILLDRDFACSCEQQDFDCNLYIGLPVLIIFILILWTDRYFQRGCKFLCAFGGCGSFWGYSLRKLLKAALVGLLWVAFVLIEADWYVCCQNDGSEQQAELACKAKENNLTHKERVIVAELKNDSRVIGSFLFLGIVFVASLMSSFGWSKCCGESTCCNRNVLYDELILEEKENALKQILRDVAKEEMNKIKEEIRGENWGVVARELIKLKTAEKQGGRAPENQNKHLLAGSSDEQ